MMETAVSLQRRLHAIDHRSAATWTAIGMAQRSGSPSHSGLRRDAGLPGSVLTHV